MKLNVCRHVSYNWQFNCTIKTVRVDPALLQFVFIIFLDMVLCDLENKYFRVKYKVFG